jgi:16S rRNA (adenine1518-N6/adenine1519-N6)-dimethyltransferase
VLKLQDDFKANPKTHPQMGNIMRWDLAPYTKIIGNLPYYITSAIIEKILLEASSCEVAVLMVQKEVIARLSAKVGSPDYGPLPILLQFRGDFAKLFNVARTSFSPAPHVDSSVFSLTFKKGVSLQEARDLYAFVSQLFLHRRKTILNNLSTITKDSASAKEALLSAGIDPTRRPEELSLAEFQKLRSQLH